ncbi:hemolysin family protein [Salipiger sp. P9]|uniref:hemolysin family protein n=1 Tax=Salipiger pentaromativorans TaxID=2943193 RepID=UPI002157ABC7|nr:hemolysin family protein [Salipiger pentaromativorans]MCR8547823.1 hemolysin family protein [Salipiger pentaromativorans]
MLADFLILLALIALNGLLAMSELAIVSARPARLRAQAARGVPGAEAALRLAETPGRFLSTVQIGITLVGVVAGAVSGATLGNRLAERLVGIGLPPAVAEHLGVTLVVLIITYLSLVAGELVPKQIALAAPERIATRVAPAMLVLSRIAAPVVWLLDRSGKRLLALLGQSGERENRVSDEDVHLVISEAEHAGVLEKEETALIGGVMRLADRRARGLMTPRHEVEIAEAGESLATLLERFRESGHSRLPYRAGGPDEIAGVLHSRDLLAATEEGFDAEALLRPAIAIHDALPALEAVEQLRASPGHMLLVYDEYGHFDGIITPMDILGAIAGGFDEANPEEPELVEREDGSFLVAGSMPVDEFAARTGLRLEAEAAYETVAGLVLERVHDLPQTGQTLHIGDWLVEIVDMDGVRIDRLLVRRAPVPEAGPASSGASES